MAPLRIRQFFLTLACLAAAAFFSGCPKRDGGQTASNQIPQTPTNLIDVAGDAPMEKEAPPEDPCKKANRLIYSGEMSFWDGQNKIIEALKNCVAENPNDADAYFRLATAWRNHYNFDEAIRAYRKTAELKPTELEAWRGLAAILNVVAPSPEAGLAESDLDAVYAKDPNLTYEDWMEYAEKYNNSFHEKQLQISARKYRAAIDMDPDRAVGWKSLGGVQMQLGNMEEAIASFRQGLKLNPALPGAALELAAALYRSGHKDEARKILAEPGDNGPENNRLRKKWMLEQILSEPAAGPENPAANPHGVVFADAAAEVGLDVSPGLDGSVSAADFTGDGWDDLFTYAWEKGPRLFQNLGGGQFTEISPRAGFDPADRRGAVATPVADVDNDGDLDIFATRGGWRGRLPDALFFNQGDGSFKEAAAESGITEKAATFGADFGDLDSDGWVDLVVANGGNGDWAPNLYYKNDGRGKFVESGKEAGLDHRGASVGATVYDLNRDRFPEVVFSNSMGQPNSAMLNDGKGHFSEASQFLSEDGGIRFGTPYANDVLIFDADGDTLFELFFANRHPDWESSLAARFGEREAGDAGNRIYRPNLKNNFTDISERAGLLRAPHSTASGAPVDFDNDGLPDLFLANGWPAVERVDRMTALRNRGGGVFDDISQAARVNVPGKGNAAAAFDADGDGDLDIYLQNGGASEGDKWPDAFFRNETASGGDWIGVKLVGVETNRAGIGARVQAECENRAIMRRVASGVGIGSANSLTLTIGLGDCPSVKTLQVYWPSGQLDYYENVPSNAYYKIVEGAEQPQKFRQAANPPATKL